MKKVYISTLGCAKNLVDSEMMTALLLDNGHEKVDNLKQADIAIINTCGFIESAKEESINEILQIAREKTNGKLSKLVVTGCLAQRYSKELEKEIPEIDLILGTTGFINIISKLDEKNSDSKLLIESADKNLPNIPRYLLTDKHIAYIKIAEGCDNLCTYCIIPKLRGKYRSRELDEIVEEAKLLAEKGVKELIVIAQDTTKYGLDLYGKKMLAELLSKLDKIDGLVWIRLLYSYPEDIDEEIISVIKKATKVLPYFDIPIQHASDKILRLMNRKTTQEQIRSKVEMIRKNLPNACIRTTVIVGFPNESDEDFNDLCKFVEEIKFDRLGAFAYSLEEDTPAAKMKEQIEESIKEDRRGILMDLQQKISMENNLKLVGKVIKVLVEDKEDENTYLGRTYRDMIEIDGLVFVNSTEEIKIGEFVDVKITQALEYDLIGEVYEHAQ